MTTRAHIIATLSELRLLMTLEEGGPQAFRVRAYDNAIQGLESTTADIATLSESELVALKGVGKSTASKIREIIETGTIKKLEGLREKYPPEFVNLTRIPGLGPKTLVMLRDRLDIHNLDDLKAALAAEKLRDLPGLGAKSEEKIGQAIERLGLHGKDTRTPIVEALPIARATVAQLLELPEVRRADYCGSLRRFREDIGDIDILVSSTRAEAVMEFFTTMPEVADVIGRGETKSSIVTRRGIQMDLRVVRPAEYGAALLYFTGSKTHNIHLRQLAIDRGWQLNEYGLSDVESGEVVASKTEKDIYAALDLAFVPPTLREDGGEIEKAAAGELPKLVQLKDIKGDLHYHTDLSGDGREPLERMVEAAAARGYSYLAITDHGEDLTINGASRRQMLAQRKKIARLQEEYPDLRLLHGCELNMGRDGSVDYDLDFVLGFDWTVASVHSYFDLDRDQQTERVLQAMANPGVSAIGHLSGRYIGRRPGIELDLEAVMEAAAATGTAIEINGALQRLDATPEAIRIGIKHGVTFVIDTDSHHTRELGRMEYGVLNAQRGWVERSMVANTWPTSTFLKWVASKRG
ncbi:MAG: DNA polymerase/3'-5' exonuclease PolX [Acidimicrobiia bacterium]|nr:DNA polymerase/3'-5' exonuclease PolX [Acidimicrobiia bacterium]RZV43743.1 MAG: DNA polymerase/3'-5' exonuclease PolX [Acidimicrobiia bacterium]